VARLVEELDEEERAGGIAYFLEEPIAAGTPLDVPRLDMTAPFDALLAGVQTTWPGDGTPYQIPISGEGIRADFEAAVDDLKTKIRPTICSSSISTTTATGVVLRARPASAPTRVGPTVIGSPHRPATTRSAARSSSTRTGTPMGASRQKRPTSTRKQ
jgi:hypothetical protein